MDIPKPSLLVVDDEGAVLNLIRTYLHEAGYSVLTAKDGKEALRLMVDSGAKIDLLITDVIMPNMNGKDLANRVSRIWPDIRVLFISAYTAETLTFHNLCPYGAELIKKPFRREELLEKVARILTVSFTWRQIATKSA